MDAGCLLLYPWQYCHAGTTHFTCCCATGLAHSDVLSAGIGGTPSMPCAGQAAKVPPPLAEELSGVVLSGKTLAEHRACTHISWEESTASCLCTPQTPPMQGRPYCKLTCLPCNAVHQRTCMHSPAQRLLQGRAAWPALSWTWCLHPLLPGMPTCHTAVLLAMQIARAA